MLALISLFIYSCNDEVQNDISNNDSNVIASEVVLAGISDDVDMDAAYEEVDDLTIAGMELDYEADQGGRFERDRRFDCAKVNKEEIESGVIITIDFGNGCVGPNGKVRAGIVQITMIGRHWEPGSTMTTELIDFSMDSVLIEGTRIYTNISESVVGTPIFSYELIGGKMTWTDGTYATRDARGTRTLYRTDNPLGDEIHIDGSAEGVNRDGENYTMIITEALVIKRECNWRRHPIPVAGTKEINVGDDLIIVNFGDGECDNLITITINGVTFEREIEFKRRRG